MQVADISFDTTDWSTVEMTEHESDTGTAYWRTKHFDDLPCQRDWPGPTLTGLTGRRLADERIQSWTLERIPLGRLGEPADLVGAVLFLASDDSRWVTGTTIVVDGGYLAL